MPNGHLDLLEQLGRRPDLWPDPSFDEPARLAEPWQFTDRALLDELAMTQRQLSGVQGYPTTSTVTSGGRW